MTMIKQLLLVISVLSLTPWAYGQEYHDLIREINVAAETYERIIPMEQYALRDFDLQKRDFEGFEDAKYMLSDQSDSIEGLMLQAFFRERIVSLTDSLFYAPNSRNHDLYSELEFLDVVRSYDSRLFSVSFNENTGGTYRSKVSTMYYFMEDGSVVSQFDFPFSSDGYHSILDLQTSSGIKYLLSQATQYCNTCMGESMTLVRWEGDHFVSDFSVELETRGWDGGLSYDLKQDEVILDYKADDLNKGCWDKPGIEQLNPKQVTRSAKANGHDHRCYYRYRFNGETFELVESTARLLTPEEMKQ